MLTFTGTGNLKSSIRLLMQTACALRVVSFGDLDLQGWDEVFENMAGLKDLKELNLTCCQSLPKERFHSFITKSQSLKTISLYENDVSSTSVAVFMEALSAKQPVKVSVESDALNDDIIASAFASRYQASTVEDLEIASLGIITGRTLQLLAKLPILNRLSLLRCEHITYEDLYGFLRERKGQVELLYCGSRLDEDLLK